MPSEVFFSAYPEETVLNVINDLLFTKTGSAISPILETIVRYVDLLLASVNPIAAGLSSQDLLVNQRVLGFWSYTLRSDGSTIMYSSLFQFLTARVITAWGVYGIARALSSGRARGSVTSRLARG